MTYQIFYEDLHPEDVEHARAYVEDYLDATYAPDRTLAVARVLDALLPDPPRPTLADMTYQERAACQRMQADVKGRENRAIVTDPDWWNGHAALLDRQGHSFRAAHDTITPRPDLPRFEWPGEQQPAPAPALPDGWRLADHPDYGRVVVTTENQDGDGYVYFTFPDDDVLGYEWHFCRPGELTYLDTPEAVPPNTLGEGSEWDDADALSRACHESHRDQIVALDADGYAFVWSGDAEWWEGSAKPKSAPYTIIHTGREADQ